MFASQLTLTRFIVLAVALCGISSGARSAVATAGAAPFNFLQPGFTQEVSGTSAGFMGGVAFRPNGDVWVDSCQFTGSPQAPRTIGIPAAATMFTLILNTTGPPTYPDYGLDLIDQHGRVLWTGNGLHKSRFDTFTVALPRRLVPAGRYQLALYGVQAERRNLLQRYNVIVAYQ